jgi:hypothetical protein
VTLNGEEWRAILRKVRVTEGCRADDDDDDVWHRKNEQY